MTEMNQEREDYLRNFTYFEQQCVEELENEVDPELQLLERKEIFENKCWMMFQTTATHLAQLYKDSHSGISLWVPFQNAAGSVTSLYKECGESQKNLMDIAFQSGYKKRNKELITWIKKHKKNIRREDLIGFICNKIPPHWSKPKMRSDSIRTTVPYYSHVALQHQQMESADDIEQEFRESVGNVFPNIRQQNTSHRSRSTDDYIHNFESRKRSTSGDVIMDSPTHKKSRNYI